MGKASYKPIWSNICTTCSSIQLVVGCTPGIQHRWLNGQRVWALVRRVYELKWCLERLTKSKGIATSCWPEMGRFNKLCCMCILSYIHVYDIASAIFKATVMDAPHIPLSSCHGVDRGVHVPMCPNDLGPQASVGRVLN